MQRKIEDYADIIHLPRPISKTHPPMSLHDRAGQFAPFSALTRLHSAAERMEEEAQRGIWMYRRILEETADLCGRHKICFLAATRTRKVIGLHF